MVVLVLPMSNVRLERTGSRDIVAKWSDISHTITRTLGDYVPRTSYVYDGSSPTRSLRFVFRSSTGLWRPHYLLA